MRTSSKPVAGLELRPFTRETTLVVTPSGDRLLVAAPVRGLEALLERCDGSRSLDRVAAASPDPATALRLLRALADAGCLTTTETY
jgi:hypothetical protein